MDASINKSQQLRRIVQILECFSSERTSLGVREIARLSMLPSSSAGRLMLEMKEMGILSQNPIDRTYSIGPRVLAWAGMYLSASDIRNIAYPFMQELHEQYHETISLYILDGSERICIERLESTANVRFVAPRIGRHLPLHAGSAGKVMLAYLPPERQKEIIYSGDLPALTEKTIVQPEVLERELAMIKAQGFATSDGEWIVDAAGVAAPIFNFQGTIFAALTISGPTQRFTKDKYPAWIHSLCESCEKISRQSGYQGPYLTATYRGES